MSKHRYSIWILKQHESLIQSSNLLKIATHTLNCFLSILDSAQDQIEIVEISSTEFDYEIKFLLNSTLNILKLKKNSAVKNHKP